MKPLSVIYYALKNRRKVISMAVSIGFSVALIYSLHFITDEVIHANDLTGLNPLTHYSEVWGSEDGGTINPIIRQIIKNPDTDRTIPVNRQQIFYISAVGGKYSVGVYSLKKTDMKYYMNRLKIKLIKGRLPIDGKKETVLDYRLAKNKGLHIGDRIGYSADKKELQIKGSYRIVGFLGGESISMLIPEQKVPLKPNEILVFHKQGRLLQSNSFLESLPKNQVNVSTYNLVMNALEKDSKDLKKLMNITVVMLIAILSISMGNASYINIFQRRYEFGLLNSVGYSPVYILGKAFFEIAFLNFAGYLAGVILTMFIAGLQYFFLFEPNGLVLRILIPEAMLQTIAVPVFTTLFSIIPVSRMMKKIDPISIIEGVE